MMEMVPVAIVALALGLAYSAILVQYFHWGVKQQQAKRTFLTGFPRIIRLSAALLWLLGIAAFFSAPIFIGSGLFQYGMFGPWSGEKYLIFLVLWLIPIYVIVGGYVVWLYKHGQVKWKDD